MQGRRLRPLIPLALVGILLAGLLAAGLTESMPERRAKAALGLSGQCVPSTSDSPGWREEPSLAQKRDEIRAVTLEGRIYLAGGLTDIYFSDEYTGADSRKEVPVRAVRQLTSFDPGTGRFEELPPMPEALNHVGMATYRGDVYVVGGHGDRLAGGDVRGGFFRYRVAERRWERLPPLPTPRGALTAGVVGDRLYAAGGMVPGEPLGRSVGTLEIFDFERGRWSRGATMPHPTDHVGGVVAGGRLYLMGGRDGRSDALPYVQRYDPASDRWEELPPLPVPTSGLDAVFDGDAIYAFGGSDERGNRLTPAVQRFDVAAERWETRPTMRTPRHGVAAALAGQRVYTFGGSACVGFEATDVVESYDVRVEG